MIPGATYYVNATTSTYDTTPVETVTRIVFVLLLQDKGWRGTDGMIVIDSIPSIASSRFSVFHRRGLGWKCNVLRT
jgi:hypothetical protein